MTVLLTRRRTATAGQRDPDILQAVLRALERANHQRLREKLRDLITKGD